MERKLYVQHALGILAVTTFLAAGPPGFAQTQNSQSAQTSQTSDRNAGRGEMASFDQFLDGHREIAEQVRKDPSLLNNQQFVKAHPALETYLEQHTDVRQQLANNPSAFLQREDRYETRENAGMTGRDRTDNNTRQQQQYADNRSDRDRDFDRRDADARRDTDNRQDARQSTSAQSNSGARNTQEPSREQLSTFDRFLDSHRQIAADLKKNPPDAESPEYLKAHPELQAFFQEHPDIQHQVVLHPNNFMQREERYDTREDARNGDVDRRDNDRDRDRRDNDDATRTSANSGSSEVADNRNPRNDERRNMEESGRTNTQEPSRGQLATFDRFLDSHHQIAADLKKNPPDAENPQYLKAHPELQSFFQEHPDIQHQVVLHPNNFMQREERYDAREDARNGDRDRDLDRRDRDYDRRDMNNSQRTSDRPEVASFDRFLDTHREEAEQLRRNPSLVNNQQFVQSHPALQAYLQQNPSVRQDLTQDPNAFMRQEKQYDRREDMDHGREMQAANFREFLGSHSGISKDLNHDPNKANDMKYRQSHPEFQSYLSAHPDVQSALSENPQNFMKSVQQPATPKTSTNGSGTTGTTTGTTGSTGSTKPQTAPAPKPPTP